MQLKRLKADVIKKSGGAKAGASKDTKLASKSSAFVLFLGDDGAILVFIEGGKVVRRLFAQSAEKEHLASLIELLNTHSDIPISVVVDMIDQSYVRHTLPPVSALGINKLVQRRLDRDFAPEDIKGALPLGRETSGRKEWSFLLISLANSAVLQQWMNVVHELPNRLLGLYLVPVESQDFIEAISAALPAESSPAQWQILVSHHKVSGYRQVVLKDGKLIFTRLTQGLNESSPDVAAGNVEQEIQNTIEYLRRLSFNDAAGLDIFVIVSQEIKERIDVRRFNTRRTKIFSPFEVSQMLGLEQAALSGDRFGDVVMSASFATLKKHRLKLLTVYGKKIEQLFQIRLAARGVAGLLLFYMIYTIGSGFLAMQSANSEAASLTDQEKQARVNLQKMKDKFNAVGEQEREYVKAGVIYKTLALADPAVLGFVRTLSPLLGEGVLVSSVDWKQESEATAAAVVTAPAPMDGMPLGSSATPQPIIPYTVSLEMEINNHDGSKERLIELSQSLLSRLQEGLPDADVTPLLMPGASNETETLQLSFNEAQKPTDEIKAGETMMSISISSPKKAPAGQGGIQ